MQREKILAASQKKKLLEKTDFLSQTQFINTQIWSCFTDWYYISKTNN